MKGTTVVVWRTEQTGEDTMGDPIIKEVPEEVANVLVMPATDARQGEITPHRSETSMTFTFPKSYTKALRECEIEYLEKRYRVLENPTPLPVELCPTEWNYTAEGARVDG